MPIVYLETAKGLQNGRRIGISNGILAPAPPERNPQNDPWDTPAAAMWRSFSPRATMR
jgi:hypothetical protein